MLPSVFRWLHGIFISAMEDWRARARCYNFRFLTRPQSEIAIAQGLERAGSVCHAREGLREASAGGGPAIEPR